MLDWSTDFTDEQWRELTAYYSLGSGTLELFQFAPLMHDLRPDTFKRYRLWVDAVTGGHGLPNGIPGSPYIQLIMCPFYCMLGYERGLLTEIKLARQLGVRKAHIADILAIAWIHAGPFGMNHAGSALNDFMADWHQELDVADVVWPKGWSVDASAFSSGVDFASPPPGAGVTASELDLIAAWHERIEGEVPPYVGFLSKYHPLALRVFRARYENAMQSRHLPTQLVALTQVHLAASFNQPAALRRALRMAHQFGTARDHVVQIVTLAQLYRGSLGMDSSFETAAAALGTWDS
jgi:hypothetical protein